MIDLHGDFVGGPVVTIDADGNIVRVIPGAGLPPADPDMSGR